MAGPIRTQAVTSAVSAVSAVPAVRERLLREQRDVIGEGGIVVEGRDIGTVVAPDAQVKLYLTADAEARAARRTAELTGADVQATQADLLRRDTIDSGRATAPLAMAHDARHLDTTFFTLDEVIDQVVALVQEALASDHGVDRSDRGAVTGDSRAPTTRCLRRRRCCVRCGHWPGARWASLRHPGPRRGPRATRPGRASSPPTTSAFSTVR